jgi:hypothetical protein
MGARGVTPHIISSWRGLNTFISETNVDEQSWIDSDNVLVNAKGEAEVLRSPKTFGNAIPSGPLTIVSMDEYQRTAGNALIIDHGTRTDYLLAAAGAVTNIRTGSNGAAWTSLSMKDTLQRIDSHEFIQILNDFSIRRNGIDPPAAAPTISYVANGGDTTVIASSLQGSYCYMNSVTGHVSQPSDLSNILGPKAAGFDVRFAVTASAQTGVDKIIFFLTEDGGSIPYLVIDNSTSNPHTVANATTNYDIVQSSVGRDTLTPEPIYNSVPITNATHMFEYKDRIFLVANGGLQYSGFETCYIGNTYESWPFLNQLNLKNDKAVGGIGTQSGALIFGEKDCHLLSGFPSDKVSSPNNVVAVTEHLDPLQWNIGITYPKTAVKTPFGVIWTDQTKRIRLWTQQGFPSEIAQPLRTELDGMTGALTARWFQHGKNGGYYVLTNGVTTLILMVYLSPANGQMQFGYGKSTTLDPEAMAVVTFNSEERFFFGKTDQIWETLDPDLAGGGWAAGTPIFFKMLIGGMDVLNFTSLHSININGGLNTLVVTHDRLNKNQSGVIIDGEPQTVDLSTDLEEADTGGTVYGIVDSPERAFHIVKFTFGLDDTQYRNISGFTVNVKPLKRLI